MRRFYGGFYPAGRVPHQVVRHRIIRRNRNGVDVLVGRERIGGEAHDENISFSFSRGRVQICFSISSYIVVMLVYFPNNFNYFI